MPRTVGVATTTAAIVLTAAMLLLLSGLAKKTAAFSPRLARRTAIQEIGSSSLARDRATTSHQRWMASVTGSVYSPSDDAATAKKPVVVVTLYTKEGCTLCDKVKDVLEAVRDEGNPETSHALRQIDITDEDQTEAWDRYKYDIPVLHVGYSSDDDSAAVAGDAYWTKHRLTADEAREALAEAQEGSFAARTGRPNASAHER